MTARASVPIDFSIRPAVPADVNTLMVIDAACFPPGIAYPRKEIAALVRAPDTLTLIVESGVRIVGFACVGLLQAPSPAHTPHGELITIDILPEFRRSRLGWHLHQRLEDWLRMIGARSIELHVAVDNTAAIQFYQRLVYQTVRRVPKYYLGTTDAWRMSKPVT